MGYSRSDKLSQHTEQVLFRVNRSCYNMKVIPTFMHTVHKIFYNKHFFRIYLNNIHNLFYLKQMVVNMYTSLKKFRDIYGEMATFRLDS